MEKRIDIEGEELSQPKYDLDLDALEEPTDEPTFELEIVTRLKEQAMTDASAMLASFRDMLASPALQLARQTVEDLQTITQQITKPALDSVREIASQMGSVGQAISEVMQNVVAPLKKAGLSWLSNIRKRIADSLAPIYKYIDFKALFRPLTAFFRLFKSNFYLVVHAAKGEKIASHMLARIWFRLATEYYNLARRGGDTPSREKFNELVEWACKEVIYENKHRISDDNWCVEAARYVFYKLIDLFAAQYVILCASGEKKGISIYIDSEIPGRHVFLKSLSSEIGVSSQTLINWIHNDELQAAKLSFYSKLRHTQAVAFLVPYTTSITSELADLKESKKSKQRHEIEGYYTVAQIKNAIGVSTKTLSRWDKAGILVPIRIKNIRYYTKQQAAQIPSILEERNSPRTIQLRQTLSQKLA